MRKSKILHFGVASSLVAGAAVGLVPGTAQAAPGTLAATLVKTTNTSAWPDPSPDPSGITYNSRTRQLIISDGEVEERGTAYPKNVWSDTNLFVTSLGGAQLATNLNTTAYSNEPTGVGFRPGDLNPDFPERLFVTDDDQARLFEVAAVDDIYGNANDTWTWTDIRFLNLGPRNDAEDVAVDLDLTRDGRLLLVDGKGKRVFVFNPGPDRVFNGIGDVVERTINVGNMGAGDPEGIAYNASRDTVFVLDDPSNRLYEISLTGTLLNFVTLPFKMKSGAGLAFAPPSNGNGGVNGYIVDRGIDNDTNQDTFNDGRLFEISIPGLAGPPPPPPPPPPPGGGTLDIRVTASTDDAEQRPAGGIALASGDLNLTQDDAAVMTVGMRFNGVTIPADATITKAYVQFVADEVQSVGTNLTIRAQLGNAATFAATTRNITTRPLTTESVAWSPAPWTAVGQRDVAQRTPDLSAVVKAALVNGWTSGNSLALVISGSGERTAESFDGGAAKAPLLHVEFTSP